MALPPQPPQPTLIALEKPESEEHEDGEKSKRNAKSVQTHGLYVTLSVQDRTPFSYRPQLSATHFNVQLNVFRFTFLFMPCMSSTSSASGSASSDLDIGSCHACHAYFPGAIFVLYNTHLTRTNFRVFGLECMGRAKTLTIKLSGMERRWEKIPFHEVLLEKVKVIHHSDCGPRTG